MLCCCSRMGWATEALLDIAGMFQEVKLDMGQNVRLQGKCSGPKSAKAAELAGQLAMLRPSIQSSMYGCCTQTTALQHVLVTTTRAI